MAKFTRIQVPLLITYELEKDNTVVLEKEMSPVLDVDMEKIETWAKEDGISIEREIIQLFLIMNVGLSPRDAQRVCSQQSNWRESVLHGSHVCPGHREPFLTLH